MATKSTKAKKAGARKSASKASASGKLIDFQNARVVGGTKTGYFLLVWGRKPYLNMEVSLRPLVYVQQPDYWGIQVIGTMSGVGIPVVVPYHVHIPLQGSMGKKGVEVIGANKSKKINVPAKGSSKR
jgi:hypothetical protein